MATFSDLPMPRGLDPLYFDRRKSLTAAFRWSSQRSEPSLCVDIGANEGQTMRSFLEWWPNSRCISFEPLPDAWRKLDQVASEFPGRAKAFNVGISDGEGTLTLHGSKAQSTNSSFRDVNHESETIAAHRGLRGKPSMFEVRDSDDSYEIAVPVESLDRFLERSTEPVYDWVSGEIDILKSDTQGWDLNVLRGSRETLSRTRVVLVEWIFDDIYGRQIPLHELDKLMDDSGFQLWDVAHIYKELDSLRTLWVDLIYARR